MSIFEKWSFHFIVDLCPKSGSQDASSLESSAVEDSRPNHKPSVKLHPTIPSVLTVNKSETNPAANSSISRTNSYSHNESLPSPVPTNSHKSSPVVKKDSFSDAEGVSFIKKMLQKESDKDRAAAAAAAGNTSTLTKQNLQNGTSPSVINGNGYAVKKSPSAGNQSYWSKFSSSQSAFLRKLFDKPKVSESPGNLNSSGLAKASSSIHCGPTTQDNRMEENGSMEKENGEPLQGFSVAQKASYFMKLEHEQRFSKWRKNSVDLGIISTVSTPTYCEQSGDISRLNTNGGKSGTGEVTSKSKYLTRPVTPSDESQLGSHVNTSESLKRQIEFGSLPRIWRNDFQSFENNATDPSAKINSDSNPSAIPKSSCTGTVKAELLVWLCQILFLITHVLHCPNFLSFFQITMTNTNCSRSHQPLTSLTRFPLGTWTLSHRTQLIHQPNRWKHFLLQEATATLETLRRVIKAILVAIQSTIPHLPSSTQRGLPHPLQMVLETTHRTLELQSLP